MNVAKYLLLELWQIMEEVDAVDWLLLEWYDNDNGFANCRGTSSFGSSH